MNDERYETIEIFGAPGVGKSTFIRHHGLQSSHDIYQNELDKLIKNEFKKKVFIPIPGKVASIFRSNFKYRYDEKAIREFAAHHKEFLELCLFVIFNSPVSSERKIRCYKFIIDVILSWWLIKARDRMVWDESFAKAVVYVCGMDPKFSDRYFSDIVRVMPKRDKYIFLDATPEQGVTGQIKRNKFNNNMPESERTTRLRSAEKYRKVAEQLYAELIRNGCTVEKHMSTIDV